MFTIDMLHKKELPHVSYVWQPSLLSTLRLAHAIEDVGQLFCMLLQFLIPPLQVVVAPLELAVLLVGRWFAVQLLHREVQICNS